MVYLVLAQGNCNISVAVGRNIALGTYEHLVYMEKPVSGTYEMSMQYTVVSITARSNLQAVCRLLVKALRWTYHTVRCAYSSINQEHVSAHEGS